MMIFHSVFDRHMPTNDHGPFYLRLYASMSTNGQKCTFPRVAWKWVISLQITYIIIIQRIARFHSGTNFDASRFNEHIIWENHEN